MQKSKEITIRLFCQKDRDNILKLLKKTFNITYTRKWWNWKYLNNPHGRSVVFVAYRNDKLVGLRTFWARGWVTPSGRCKVYQGVDSAVHPSEMRQGIYSQLTHVALKHLRGVGSQAIISFPNSQSLPAVLKLGWSYIRKIRHWCTISFSGNRCNDASASMPFANEWMIEPRISSVNRLFRDDHYLRWRYKNHPNFQYDIWPLGRFKGQTGFAVTRVIKRYNVPMRFLVDICGGIATEGVDQREALFHVRRYVGGRVPMPLVILESSFGCHPHDFASAGFMRIPKTGANFTIRDILQGTPDALSELLITPGDMDTI